MSADGCWNLVLKTPVGERKATMTLTSDGGTLTGRQVAEGRSVDIFDGKVSGDDLSWKISVTEPMPLTLTFKARVDGDTMSGTADIGWMASFSFSGMRG